MKISQSTADVMNVLRDCTDGCAELVKELVRLPDFDGAKATAGYFVNEKGKIIDDYWWLVMPDESVVDAYGQDGECEPLQASKKDKRHKHYFPYTSEPGIPMAVLNLADHISASTRHEHNRKTFGEMVDEAYNPITLYRGVNAYQEGSNFYTPDKEWARQFTQSGQDSEIKTLRMGADRIHRADPLPLATEADFDEAMQEALTLGKQAIWVDEGQGEPDSVFLIPMAVRRAFKAKTQEAFGGRPVGDPNAQQHSTMPDSVNAGGHEAVPQEEEDREFKPEEFEQRLSDMQLDHDGSPSEGDHVGEDDGDLTWEDLDHDEEKIKEVDHPEFMPDEGPARYDPELELGKADQRQPGYNRGHPLP